VTDPVAYRREPMSIHVDELQSLRNAFTTVGGDIIPTSGREASRSSGATPQ